MSTVFCIIGGLSGIPIGLLLCALLEGDAQRWYRRQTGRLLDRRFRD